MKDKDTAIPIQARFDLPIVAPLPPHPTPDDDAVVAAAMNKLTKRVLRWLREPEQNATEVYEQLMECRADDGFEFAYNLKKQYYFESDSTLVSILDGWHGHLSSAYQDAVRHWREINAIGDEEYAEIRKGAA